MKRGAKGPHRVCSTTMAKYDCVSVASGEAMTTRQKHIPMHKKDTLHVSKANISHTP